MGAKDGIRETAEDLNVLGRYLSLRDVPALTAQALNEAVGTPCVELLVLFGGSILEGIETAAEAMRRGVAQKLMLVGGEGHTTETLRKLIHSIEPSVDTTGRMEADVIADYLKLRHGLSPDLIERESTNCGNNISNALAVLDNANMHPQTVLLMQDSTMQRRMAAGLRKMWAGREVRCLHYAAYVARLCAQDGRLAFDGEPIRGMWSVEHYITLLMGEIPRLMDNEQGYGPKGKGYIAHVEVPGEVVAAFERLKKRYVARAQWTG